MIPTRIVCLGLVVVGLLGSAAAPLEKLPIGSPAPKAHVSMTATDSTMHTLASAAKANGLLVVFSSPACPWVKAWQDRYKTMAQVAKRHDVGMLMLNANADRRRTSDSRAAMSAQAARHAYAFPYVVDEGARMADAFGATTTPGVFLFDDRLRLVYRGAIDDDARNANAVRQPYVLSALRALGTGDAIDPMVTDAVGCEIKQPAASASREER